MKKLLLILLTIPIVYTACKKDEDDTNNSSNNTSASIVDGWYVIDAEVTSRNGYYQNYPSGKVIIDEDIESWSDGEISNEDIISSYYEFTQNEIGVFLDINWSLYSLTLVDSDGETIKHDSLLYSKEGNNLIFWDDMMWDIDEENVFNITTLNNSTLELSSTYSDTGWTSSGPIPNQNVVYFYEEEAIITFSRDNSN